jgi:hypothetical protein
MERFLVNVEIGIQLKIVILSQPFPNPFQERTVDEDRTTFPAFRFLSPHLRQEDRLTHL